MIIKRGDKNKTVAFLQELLDVVVDGDFGPVTENAVRQFQSTNNLKVDGLVGEQTWKKIVNITDGYIFRHITLAKNRPIKYIAIHYTAGASSKRGSAQNVRNVFLTRNASADFVVDDDTIIQINPNIKDYYCWAVGDKKNIYTGGGKLYGVATNKNTISIEICSNLKTGYTPTMPNHEGWFFTRKSLNNALKLTKYLMLAYNIPNKNVIRHYDVSGKLCPGIHGFNDGYMCNCNGKQTTQRNNSDEWIKFKEKL